ncbi:LysR substrate-binding domain-containing protein [Pantoea agglomerans]|uniref:LysR substrate-binding domain-containing protein n=1 Tax=Enterobacter agglomerans TaxID=549 RepID=UPI00301A9902
MPDKTLSGQFEHGEVDVALLTPKTTPPTLHTRQLFNEEYVCLLNGNHPLAGSATLSLDEFCA